MKVTCPKDVNHKRFSVTAHVTEDWEVNEKGDFQEVLKTYDQQTVHRPNSQDLYTCLECGTEAKVKGV